MKYYLAVSIFCFFVSLHAQDKIFWSVDTPLHWSNFTGSSDKNSIDVAKSATGLNYEFTKYQRKDTLMVIAKVKAVFHPSKSWCNPELLSDIALSHQQLYFDISELFARKMTKQIANTQFTDNTSEEIAVIYKETIKELEDYQNKYYYEIKFSQDPLDQKRWDSEVKQALAEY